MPLGPDSAEARRLRAAFDLLDAGVEMKRAALRREDPGADESTIESRLGAWLQERPGAEHGDAEGCPVDIDAIHARIHGRERRDVE